ncbi:hypothetical protein BKP56_09135 [Marinilactibacillus sp. 15R]|uniref:hypothetical protein n=1 Tax=Marinilactibacillus sp. 15R TaxID=1911586 RepID=UPI00090AC21C|nr:hypothetical protein [Marinilactibacillus sp. 15R]API89407.1 hypothetical protein BKP56_09135 [Marinilactibacillus sp. 15R]
MTVTINQQEQLITIITKGGTAEVTGFIAKVNKFPVSLYIKPKDKWGVQLVVSDIKTGTVIRILNIHPLEFWQADTKVKALYLLNDKLEQFSPFMSEETIKQIKVKRAAYPEVPKPTPTEKVMEWIGGAGE